MKRFNYFKYWYIDFLRYLNAKTHRSKVYFKAARQLRSFTSHFSLKRAGATHVALCDRVGSYYRHWCGAFTLAEVLITLGIIGVVAAMTLPTLINNAQNKQLEVT